MVHRDTHFMPSICIYLPDPSIVGEQSKSHVQNLLLSSPVPDVPLLESLTPHNYWNTALRGLLFVCEHISRSLGMDQARHLSHGISDSN